MCIGFLPYLIWLFGMFFCLISRSTCYHLHLKVHFFYHHFFLPFLNVCVDLRNKWIIWEMIHFSKSTCTHISFIFLTHTHTVVRLKLIWHSQIWCRTRDLSQILKNISLIFNSSFLLFFFFNWNLTGVDAVKLLGVVVPERVQSGQWIELNCAYQLEGDTLYALSWTFNGKEFYRYVPGEHPRVHIFPLPHFEVNVSPTYFESLVVLN